MSNMDNIVISDPILEKKVLTNNIKVSEEFTKFVKEKQLYIKYDADIKADDSILNIPATAAVLPFAWLNGSDIYVGSLDKTFKESMDCLQNTFKEIYPRIPFTTEIHADKLVDNKNEPLNPKKRTGLLFSGGVDSTYTLISNFELKPKLIMLWGVDNFAYPERRQHWEKATSIYTKYAQKNNLEIFIVKTNISQIFDDRKIEHRYHKELYNGKYRFTLSHSLILLPTAAPLSMGRFDTFFIASSHANLDRPLRPSAALPKLDEKIIWADLKVLHHGNIFRQNKLEALREYLNKGDITFRVCLRSNFVDGQINDGTCEKCSRTIINLVILGIDPNLCGFKVDETTWKDMKSMLKKRRTTRVNSSWNKVHKIDTDNIEDLYGSKEFFEWFRDFDLKTTEKNWFYTDLYTSLPYSASKILDKLFVKMEINVHGDAFNREKKEQVNN